LAEVRVQEGEPLENALRRFKRKVQQEDIIKEVKRHSYYLKPGEKKRVKAALARKRNRKKARKSRTSSKQIATCAAPRFPRRMRATNSSLKLKRGGLSQHYHLGSMLCA